MPPARGTGSENERGWLHGALISDGTRIDPVISEDRRSGKRSETDQGHTFPSAEEMNQEDDSSGFSLCSIAKHRTENGPESVSCSPICERRPSSGRGLVPQISTTSRVDFIAAMSVWEKIFPVSLLFGDCERALEECGPTARLDVIDHAGFCARTHSGRIPPRRMEKMTLLTCFLTLLLRETGWLSIHSMNTATRRREGRNIRPPGIRSFLRTSWNSFRPMS
jgi:hypothetical protein